MVACNHDCFHCKFLDCIESDYFGESEIIDQFALTKEQKKRKLDLERWHKHGEQWAKTHKKEAKAYHHKYYMARRDEAIIKQREYRAKKKAASSLQTESGAVEN